MLCRQPGSVITTVAVLALGTGIVTAMYSAIDSVLWRPLPYSEPASLVTLHETTSTGVRTRVALRTLEDWRERARSFTAVAGYTSRTYLVTADSDHQDSFVASVAMASGDLPAVLGVPLLEGRMFTEVEERAGARLAVLTAVAARRLYADASSALGHNVLLNEEPYEIVGVLTDSFWYPIAGRSPDAVVPLDHEVYGTSRTVRSLEVVARRLPRVALTAARDEMQSLSAGLALQFPETHAERGAAVLNLREHLRGDAREPLLLLGTAAMMVLGVAVANVAGLRLESSLHRARELGIRAALGATPASLTRLLSYEALLLAAIGTIAGWGVAVAGLAGLPKLLAIIGGADAARSFEAAAPKLDTAALLLTAIVCGCSALIASSLPAALLARRDARLLLAADAAGSVSGSGMRRALVAAQTGITLALVLAAGLLLREFASVASTDPGFDGEDVLRFGIGIPEVRYDSDAAIIAFHERLSTTLGELPGVDDVGFVGALPLGGRRMQTWLERANGTDRETDRARVRINVISPGYLEALDISVPRGRAPRWSDRIDTPRLAWINEALAKAVFPDGDALGELVSVGWRSEINPLGTRWQVAGVLGDVREVSLTEPPTPTVYLPASQFPLEGGSYLLRVRGRDQTTVAAIRDAVRTVDPDLQQVVVSTMSARFAQSLAPQRAAFAFAFGFGLFGLALMGVGTYGMLAIEAARRRREMAIRKAVGASRRDVRRAMLATALGTALWGAAAAAVVYPLLHHALRNQLYGVGVADPTVLAGGAFVVLSATVAASLGPAWRVARASPLEIVRSDCG